MISQGNIQARSLFDFGPLARNYEQWYETPDGMANDLTQRADVLRFLPRAETGMRLLEVGCGTGHWTRFFAALGYTVVAVDVSSEMINAALESPKSAVGFQMADAMALPFKDGAFDIAAAMTTLEFVANPSEALREMARCVRQGGHILIGTLNRCAPLNRQRLTEGREPYVSAHLYSSEGLCELLRPFGHIRMAASDPDGGFLGKKNPRKRSHASSGTGLDGPFMVAEVRK